MTQQNGFMMRIIVGLAVLATIGILGGGSAHAQREWTFGPVDGNEFCNGGIPTGSCGVTGHIIVGTTLSPTGTNIDAYVVRTNSAGTPIWQWTYDIDGKLGNDVPYGITEAPATSLYPAGYIVVGKTTLGNSDNTTDIFVLRLNCSGSVVWSHTYGKPGENDVARSVIAHSNGDFVIAGWTFGGPSGTQDGYLLRISPAGAITWGKVYDGGAADYFYGLTEAKFAGAGGNPGDIVVAGGTTSYGNGTQGWALRVGSGGGLMLVAPQGAANFGGTKVENFDEVVELQTGNEAGNLVFAGHTTSFPNSIDDAYLIKTGPSPCTLLKSRIIGDLGGPSMDIAVRVREVTVLEGSGFPAPLALPGSLIITGVTNNGNSEVDMMLLPLSAATLIPPVTGGFAYGDHGLKGDGGFYVADDIAGSGFAIAGYTSSNRDVAVHPGDPGDMYLVTTDPQGHTNCQTEWVPNSQAPLWAANCQGATITDLKKDSAVVTTGTIRHWDVITCGTAGKARSNDESGDGAGLADADAVDANAPALHSTPNPVMRGDQLVMDYTFPRSITVDLTLTDMTGAIVMTRKVECGAGHGTLSISTDALPSGTYIVKMNGAGTTLTTKVIVAQR
ncbi:MAG: hypothetical protein JWQ98_1433 [Chlorobi bacterium]|nr:hypothetical protein [Chlorobiota bacterium]